MRFRGGGIRLCSASEIKFFENNLFIATNLRTQTRLTRIVLDRDAMYRGIWVPTFGEERHTASVFIN